MFIKLVCTGTAVIAGERGIFAKHPPGRRRMAAENTGSKEVLMRASRREKGCGQRDGMNESCPLAIYVWTYMDRVMHNSYHL